MVDSRNPELTKEKILKEAEIQFAEKGIFGASVNVIAENAKVNKRMIYHYFGSKENLYKQVLKLNFSKLNQLGQRAFKNKEDPILCAKQIISDYYFFLRDNPNYIKIIAREEILGAKYAGQVISDTLGYSYDKIYCLYREGVIQGVFKPDLDIDQLLMSTNALCFITFTRKELLHVLWGERIEEKLEERLQHIYGMVLSTMCK